MRRISALGLTTRSSGDQRVIDLSVSITGVSSEADPGNTGTSVFSGGRSISPQILSQQEYSFSPKGTGQVDVTITGVEARGQAEEPEGADVTIYIDGVYAAATVPALLEWEPPTAGFGVGATGGFGPSNYYESEQQRKKKKKKELAALLQELYDMSPGP